MRKSILYLLISFSAIILLSLGSCSKTSIPGNIVGTWKLILKGGGNADHRIDTFKMTRSNDSILKEEITFNTDDSTGELHLVGLGRDSGTYKQMDSVYEFSWIYFGDGPEIWIHLKENPKNRFHVWTDSTNIHLHVNYYDDNYLCDYYPLIKGDSTVQEIFQKQY